MSKHSTGADLPTQTPGWIDPTNRGTQASSTPVAELGILAMLYTPLMLYTPPMLYTPAMLYTLCFALSRVPLV